MLKLYRHKKQTLLNFEKTKQVTINEIVEGIYREGKFRPLCMSLAKNNVKAEELHSIFIETLLNIPDSVIEANNDGALNFFCVTIINRIWGKRLRYKITTGQTHDLFQYTDTFEGPSYKNFVTSTDQYDFKIDYTCSKAKRIIENEFFHTDKDRMYKARMFYYSQPVPFIKNPNGENYEPCGNPPKFARKSGIHEKAIRKARDRFIEFLKKKLK